MTHRCTENSADVVSNESLFGSVERYLSPFAGSHDDPQPRSHTTARERSS